MVHELDHLYVQEKDRVRAVGSQSVSVVDAVTLDCDIVHEVSPLLLEQIFATLETVEQQVPSSGCKMGGVVISGSMELQRDVSVNSDGEIIVENTYGLKKFVKSVENQKKS